MRPTRLTAGCFAIALAVACAAVGDAPAVAASAVPRAQSFPGGAILFRSGRVLDGPLRLHTIDANGAPLRDLGLALDLDAKWSPDGRLIAFSEHEGDDWTDVYVQRADGGGRRRIARSGNRPAVFQGQLSWAPDGRRVAFTAPPGRGRLVSAIWVVGADGRGRRRLTAPRGASDIYPSWSPDGRWIAFVRHDEPCRRSVCGQVFRIRTDGRQLRRLTGAVSAVIGRPTWSPDGRRLAYGLCCGDGAYVVNADGTGRHAIKRPATAYVSWSPNGRWIALVDGETHVVRPNATGYRRISDKGTGAASWSPDSRAVAIGDRCCGPDVWVVAADGSGEQRLTEGWRYGYGNYDPQWNPRGRPAPSLGGTPVTPAIPTDSVAESALLRTARTVERLSADGSRVAVAYSSNKVEAWDVASGRIVRFPFLYVRPPNQAFGSRGFALAGDRVAATRFSSGGGIDTWALSSATLEIPKPTEFVLGSLSWPELCCSIPLEHLEGDGPLLVVDSWGPCRISQNPPCASGPKFGGRLHRVEESRVVQIAVDPGPLTLQSVAGDRILVDRENGALQLFRADGTPLFAITYGPAQLIAAHLEGNNVAVLTTEGLSAYDARTGDLRHHRRLAAPDARLVDLQSGVAVYLSGDEIHLHRLSDGREGVIRPDGRGPVLAELEETGLFYSYAVADGTSPGRVAFVRFGGLPGI